VREGQDEAEGKGGSRRNQTEGSHRDQADPRRSLKAGDRLVTLLGDRGPPLVVEGLKHWQ